MQCAAAASGGSTDDGNQHQGHSHRAAHREGRHDGLSVATNDKIVFGGRQLPKGQISVLSVDRDKLHRGLMKH
jgi:hypothetical protein